MVVNINQVSSYSKPGTHIFSLIPRSHPIRQDCHSPHIKDEEIEAQRGKETFKLSVILK